MRDSKVILDAHEQNISNGLLNFTKRGTENLAAI